MLGDSWNWARLTIWTPFCRTKRKKSISINAWSHLPSKYDPPFPGHLTWWHQNPGPGWGSIAEILGIGSLNVLDPWPGYEKILGRTPWASVPSPSRPGPPDPKQQGTDFPEQSPPPCLTGHLQVWLCVCTFMRRLEETLVHQLGSTGCPVSPGICLSLSCYHYAWHYMCILGINSGSHAFEASTSLTELSSQAPVYTLLQIKVPISFHYKSIMCPAHGR